MRDKHRVLLVEDDLKLAALVKQYLSQHEFSVELIHRGDDAVAQFKADHTDIVLLDLMLPGVDGLAVCRTIRQTFNGPVLMLTAKGDDVDHIIGLELGADDYIIKPVEPRVLLARMRSHLRRPDNHRETEKQTHLLKFDALTVNQATQEASIMGRPLELTTQEFELLWLLATHAGSVLSRDAIYQHLRGIEYDGLDRTVDVCVSNLRKKISEGFQFFDQCNEATKGQNIIKTIWRKGYLFVLEPHASH